MAGVYIEIDTDDTMVLADLRAFLRLAEGMPGETPVEEFTVPGHDVVQGLRIAVRIGVRD